MRKRRGGARAWRECPLPSLSTSTSRSLSFSPFFLSSLFSPHSQEYIGKLASSQAKGDDYETAAAQIGVEVYSAMSAAVGNA